MRRYIIAALLTITVAFPIAANAQNIVVDRENLISILSGFHGIPKADYWANLDAAATVTTIMDISTDESLPTIIRSRALLALAYLDDPRSLIHLTDQARSASKGHIRASATEAVSKLKGAGTVSFLGKSLEDPDVMVRLTAVRHLSRIGTPEARDVLRVGAKKEKNLSARSAMNRALQGMR